jgi:predicted DNA-binding transcriptional regulator YafY
MRASRLVSILLLLQARGRMTAAQLAAELEVSVRTVYRDVESLHEAGIPLYGDAANAVWAGRALQVRYRRWKEPTDVDRRLEPYGLVLKAGRWYLVAAPGPRTYRVDQILDLRVLDEEFGVPEGFELARYWQAYLADFRAHLHQADAVVRLAPGAAAQLSGPAAAAVAEGGVTEAGGWIRAVVPIESVEQACREFLALGPDIEVLEPAALRARMAAIAQATAARYGFCCAPGGPHANVYQESSA